MSDSKYGLSSGQKRVRSLLWTQGGLLLFTFILFALVVEHMLSLSGGGPEKFVGYLALFLLFVSMLCSFQLFRIIFWRK